VAEPVQIEFVILSSFISLTLLQLILSFMFKEHQLNWLLLFLLHFKFIIHHLKRGLKFVSGKILKLNSPPLKLLRPLVQHDSHKSDKRHKPNKRQPFSKGPKYERYTPLIANCTTILEEAFNLEVPIKLPLSLPPRLGLERTKYCRYHRSYGHNTKDY